MSNTINSTLYPKIMANISQELVPLALEVIRQHNAKGSNDWPDELIDKMNQNNIFIENRKLLDPITQDFVGNGVVLEIENTTFRILGNSITKEVAI